MTPQRPCAFPKLHEVTAQARRAESESGSHLFNFLEAKVIGRYSRVVHRLKADNDWVQDAALYPQYIKSQYLKILANGLSPLLWKCFFGVKSTEWYTNFPSITAPQVQTKA